MVALSSEQRCASQMPDVCTVAGRLVLNNNPSTFSCSWHRMGMPHQWGENYGRSEMQLNQLEGGENESSRQYFSKRKRKKNIYGNLPCTRQYAHSFCVFYSKFATYKVSVIGLLWQKKKKHLQDSEMLSNLPKVTWLLGSRFKPRTLDPNRAFFPLQHLFKSRLLSVFARPRNHCESHWALQMPGGARCPSLQSKS